MRNIKLVLEYEGTAYKGWQSQKEGPTVQSTVEECIARLTGQRCRLIGAGRTDSGVHALGQVAAFKTYSGLDAATMKRALNALLPPDIRVMSASDEDGSFHPRFGASLKTYFYLISNTPHASPFLRRYAWRVPQGLDGGAMSRAAALLRGRHDFRAFMGAGSSVKSSERTLSELRVEHLEGIEFLGANIGGRFVRITVKGEGFLRHMVRNIVGTLVDVGRGKIAEDAVKEILASGERSKAGPTAPPQGLFLKEVLYY
jgi:tRNA pseudouridine38-40 synthase